MYERFTPRARWVMEQAGREAKRMEQDYIGTEHLLLALLQERQGHAHRILKQLLVDFKKLAKETERLAERGSHNLAIGKLRQTPHVKNVQQFAQEEAKSRHLALIGTVPLLMGLLQEEDGIAAMVLTQNKVTLRGVSSIAQSMAKAHIDLAKEEDLPGVSLLRRPWVAGGIVIGILVILAAGISKIVGWW